MNRWRPVADPSAPPAAPLVPRRLLLIVAAAVIGAGLLVAVAATGLMARGGMAMTLASREEIAGQQAAAERHIARAYEQAVDQVRKARGLRLAIPAAQADAIASKALTDLVALRQSALVALGQAVGLGVADADRYAKAIADGAAAGRAQPQPSPTPVLLAPRLYAIVSRMGELAGRISDEATTALTASPTSSPTPSPGR